MPIKNWRRNLVALFLAQTVTIMGFSFVFPFYPLYVQTLGVHGTAEAAQWAGWVIAAGALAMAAFQPVWGNLADRWGRKPMLLRSMLGGSLAVLLMGLATSPEQLVVLRLLQGALSGTMAPSTALAASSVPKHRLGFAMGVIQVAMFLGISVGPLVGGVVADHWGYRVPFFVAGSLTLLGFCMVLGLVHENFTRPPASAPRPNAWKESRSLLAISLLPMLIAVVFLVQLGGVIVSPMLSLFVEELGGTEGAGTAAGLLFAATGATSAISAVVLGRIGDRIGHSVILPVSLAGCALTYFPQAAVQQVWQLFLLRALLGLFLGGLMPSANALLAGLVSPERRGALFGVSSTASCTATAVGPLSGAAIATYLGLRTTFLVTGVIFVLAFGWVSLTFHRRPLPALRPSTGYHAN